MTRTRLTLADLAADDDEPDELLDADDWSPTRPPPQVHHVAPGTWTPEHYERRFVEAFEILRFLRVKDYKLGFGAAWPAYQYTWADLVHQSDLSESEKQERAREKLRPRLTATADQVQLVDFVHGELWAIIGRLPDYACFVVAYCHGAAMPPWQQEHYGGPWGYFDAACLARGVRLNVGISTKNSVFHWRVGILNREKRPVL